MTLRSNREQLETAVGILDRGGGAADHGTQLVPRRPGAVGRQLPNASEGTIRASGEHGQSPTREESYHRQSVP